MDFKLKDCLIAVIAVLIVILVTFGSVAFYDRIFKQKEIDQLQKEIRDLRSSLYHVEEQLNQ